MRVAAALAGFLNKMSLARYEDIMTRMQIPVEPLLKGIMNLHMISDHGNERIDSEGFHSLQGIHPDTMYHTKASGGTRATGDTP